MFYVNADMDVVAKWKSTSQKSTTQNSTDVCQLTWNTTESSNKSILTSNSTTTCIAHIKADVELGILIQIAESVPPGTFVYIEKVGYNVSDCRNKHVVITADDPCKIVFSTSELHLFVQGHATVIISDISVKHSQAICQNSVTEYPKVSDMQVCPTNEFNLTISCFESPNQVCSFELQSDCYVALRNRYVKFNCLNDNIQANHTALIIYPDLIKELDLSDQDVSEIGEDAFLGVTITEKVDLSNNKISKLHPQAFNGIRSVRLLHLQGNQIETLDINII